MARACCSGDLTGTVRIAGRSAASTIASASLASFGGKTIHWIVFLPASLWRFTKGFTWIGGIRRTSWPRAISSRAQ